MSRPGRAKPPRTGPGGRPVLDVEEIRDPLGGDELPDRLCGCWRTSRRPPGRCVEDDDDLTPRPDARQPELLELADDRRRVVVRQAAVRRDGDDLAGLDAGPPSFRGFFRRTSVPRHLPPLHLTRTGRRKKGGPEVEFGTRTNSRELDGPQKIPLVNGGLHRLWTGTCPEVRPENGKAPAGDSPPGPERLCARGGPAPVHSNADLDQLVLVDDLVMAIGRLSSTRRAAS